MAVQVTELVRFEINTANSTAWSHSPSCQLHVGHGEVGPTHCKSEGGLQGKATAPEKAAFVGCTAAGATDIAAPILKRWLLPPIPTSSKIKTLFSIPVKLFHNSPVELQ